MQHVKSPNVNESGNCVKKRKTDFKMLRKFYLFSFVEFIGPSSELWIVFYIHFFFLFCFMPYFVLRFSKVSSPMLVWHQFSLLNVCDSWLFLSQIIFSWIFHFLKSISLLLFWRVTVDGEMLSTVSWHVQTLNNNEACVPHDYFH